MLDEITNLAIAQKEKSELEVIKAIEEVKIAQIKTQVIEIGANEIISAESKEVTKHEDVKREEIKVDERIVLSSKEDKKIPSFDKALDGYLDFRYGFVPPPGFLIIGDVNSFSVGTTSYADLNTRSTGSDI